MHVKLSAMWLTAFGFTFLVAHGCGNSGGPLPETAKVHGTVTYNDKPLTKGTVTFVPIQGKGGETGQSASGNIESNGSYELTTFNTGDGALLGQHTAVVLVRDEGSLPAAKGEDTGVIRGKMPTFDGKSEYRPPKSLIPEKYAKSESSPLKYTVTKGDNSIDIKLKD